MFQIGQTSGTCKSAAQGHEVIAGFEDYVDKLAKKAKDIPKKTLAPTKIAQITDGCFSAASTIETGIECACSGDATSDSDNANSPADQAAQDAKSDCTGKSSDSQSNDSRGSCGGRSSTSSKTCSGTKQKQTKTDTKEEKKCCGGGTSQDKKTGTKLSTLVQPSTVQDVTKSTYQAMMDAQEMSEVQFQSTYCATRPFPECAACQFAQMLNEPVGYNIQALVTSIEDGLTALMQGNIDVADRIFSCPGMMAAMFEAELGPFGKVLGKTAAGAVIGMTALHGAVKSFNSCYGAAWNTDLRREVMSCAGRVVRAGSSVPPQFVTQANDILRDMGCQGDTLIKLKTSDRVPWSSRPASNFNLFSEAAIGYSISDAVREKVYLSDQRKEASEKSKKKANQALAEIKGSLDTAREVIENPYAALIRDQLVPAVRIDNHQRTEDTIVQPGVIYFQKNQETGQYEIVETKPGEDLDVYRAQAPDNELYVVVNNGLTEPNPILNEDPVSVHNRIYYYKDPLTGAYIELNDIEDREDLTPYRERYGEIFSRDKYDVSPLEGDLVSVRSFVGNGVCLLSDGTMLSDRVSFDSASYENCVNTPSLITKTGVAAADMAKINGLNLTEREIKMAYLLDQAANGTIPPDDVEGFRVETILDSLVDA